MKILDKYIGKIIIHYTLMVFAALVGLFAFVTFIDQLADVGTGTYGLLDAMLYVFLTIPRTIYDLFPMATLLGAILGLSSMAVDSELIVIRSAGVSTTRLVGSVLKVGGLLAIIALIIGELISPFSETMALRSRAEAMQEHIKQQGDFGLWMRDQQSYVSVGEVLPDLSVLNLKIFEFDKNGRLRSIVAAKQGRFDNERWRLEELKQTLIESEQADTREVTSAYWRTSVTPKILSVFLIRPDQLSGWQLHRYINHLQTNNQNTRAYELAFWDKLITPLATAVMMILAIPFVFRQIRSGGFGQSLFAGIMLGMGFYILDKGFGYFVLVYELSPFMGAILPILLFSILGMYLMKRVS